MMKIRRFYSRIRGKLGVLWEDFGFWNKIVWVLNFRFVVISCVILGK